MAQRIHFKRMRHRPIVIGIGGGSGSGKTYLAHQIRQEAGQEHVSVLSMDQYFRSNTALGQSEDINFDHPAHLDFKLMLEHICALKDGKTVNVPAYDFHKRIQTADAVVMRPTRVIVVEGLFVLALPLIRHLDLCCFLEVDTDQRLLGRILRDVQERDANVEAVIDRYQRFVRPSYQVFVAPTAQNADVVVQFSYRRSFFSQMLIHLVREYVQGRYDLKHLIELVRSEDYRPGIRPGEGAMPFSIDIFKLARDYPEAVVPRFSRKS